MTPSPWLYSYLKGREQFRPTAYRPTPRDRWTIAYGHTAGVKQGDTCTLAEGDAFLEQDVAVAVADVARLVRVPLTQPQYDALVSFVYNVGAAALEGTHTLAALNAGHYTTFASAMLTWNHQDGAVLAGLTTRREQERARFLQAA